MLIIGGLTLKSAMFSRRRYWRWTDNGKNQPLDGNVDFYGIIHSDLKCSRRICGYTLEL